MGATTTPPPHVFGQVRDLRAPVSIKPLVRVPDKRQAHLGRDILARLRRLRT